MELNYFEGREYYYYLNPIKNLDPIFIGYDDLKQFPCTPKHIQDHPEFYNFRFCYFPVFINRNGSGCWCGYVDISIFQLENYNFEDEKLYVHGGITFSSEKTIGFDCHHYGDLSPFSKSENNEQLYRDREYVLVELKNLCKQLFAMFPKWSPSTHKQFPKEIQEIMVKKYLIWYQRKFSTKMSYIVEKKIMD